MNKPDCPYTNQEMIRDLCVLNMNPYHLQGLHYLMKEAGDPYKEGIERYGTIDVGDFIKSLGALYNQFRFYLALEELKRGRGEIAYNLSNEGRLSAGYPYFNIYKHNDDPVSSDDNNQTGKSKSLPDDFNRVFVKRVKRDIEDLEDLLIGGFPNYSMTVHRIPGSNKIGFLAEVNSVFEVAWYALARLVVMDEEEIDANSLARPRICKACGRVMNVEGSRQEYCLSLECQRIRKRKNRQDCDARKRQAEQED